MAGINDISEWERQLFPEQVGLERHEPKQTYNRLGVDFVRTLESEISVSLANATRLTLEQLDQAKHLGSVVWDCGMAFCKYAAAAENILVSNQKVLELGSGTGICGLALGALGLAKECILTDVEALQDLLRRNITRNQLDSVAKAMPYEWGSQVPVELRKHNFDCIVCSDCLYDSDSHCALLNSILELSTLPTTIVLFVLKIRYPKLEHNFFKELNSHGYQIQICATDFERDIHILSASLRNENHMANVP